MHQDIVFECPPQATLLGSSPRCAVQGMYSPRRFITVQGHPEFNEEIEIEIIKNRTEVGFFSENQAQEGLSRVGNEHDGISMGATFLRFLLEA
jgi:GMP synthase-like glutamine amidotransferase